MKSCSKQRKKNASPESSISLHTNENLLGLSWSNQLYFTLGVLRLIQAGPSNNKLYLHHWFSSSQWNVSHRKLAAEASEEKTIVFLVWLLLSWDRQCSLCLRGIQEIRDQWEVLQCSLMGDTSVLHLKPVGQKGTWVKHKNFTFSNILHNLWTLQCTTNFKHIRHRGPYQSPEDMT